MMDFLFPKQCINCEKYGDYLCSRCLSHFIQFDSRKICHVCKQEVVSENINLHESCICKSNIEKVEFIVRFNSIPKILTHLIKYGFYFDYIDLMFKLTMLKLDISWMQNSILVPVPLHQSKKNYRGFNQTELYATKLSKYLSKIGVVVPVMNILVREKNTITQVGMNRQHRHDNLRDVFKINSKVETPRFHRLILVDDVYTTGTTLEECAKTLRKAGYRRVEGLVFARA